MGTKVSNSGCVVIDGCLQPQMKKYRFPWRKSTTHDNILYFAAVPGPSLQNPAICLWKAQNSLVRRGLRSP
jgi:hypothetical protein